MQFWQCEGKETMAYKVTYAIDYIDPNPTVETFESEYEAIEFLSDEVERRVAFIVSHASHEIDDSEYEAIRETEYSLARIDRID
jgi:hypothetical protein